MSEIKLEVLSGSGNIFSVIDSRYEDYDNPLIIENIEKLINLGNRRTEGVLLLDNGTGKTNFNARFFNPDGSSGMMCGNGGRTIIYYAREKGIIRDGEKIKLKLADITYSGVINGDNVCINFPPPLHFIDDIELICEDYKLNTAFINVGTEHAVINSTQLPENYNINSVGKAIRFNTKFGSKGANANFYKVLADKTLELRTYERGVEAETGACGTGAISTAFVAVLRNEATSPVKLIPTSKSPVEVEFNGKFPNKIDSISYRGKVEKLDEVIIKI